MRIGSLCTGYGGLDMAAASVFNAETVWVADIDKHASQLLAERLPGVPNLGDLTAVDWSEIEPVDILTAGYPCQPFSHAGNRKGETDERHIWPYIATAIRVLRPRYVVLENVRGHLTLGFDRVLGDIASIGFDAEWAIVSAAQVGACHRRERLFIVATDATGAGRATRRAGTDEQPRGTGQPASHRGVAADTSGERHGGRQDSPTVGRLDQSDASKPLQRQRTRPESEHRNITFGKYAAAVDRWTGIVGRPPPEPTDNGRLNPAFVEWMMGLPAGWVTGLDLSPTQQLKMLGNGVVPQQAAAAIAGLLERG